MNLVIKDIFTFALDLLREEGDMITEDESERKVIKGLIATFSSLFQD